jgi:hypothetical protein
MALFNQTSVSTHPSAVSLVQVIYFSQNIIVDGKQKLTFQTHGLPKYVSIDHFGTRPDLVRSDNHLGVD